MIKYSKWPPRNRKCCICSMKWKYLLSVFEEFNLCQTGVSYVVCCAASISAVKTCKVAIWLNIQNGRRERENAACALWSGNISYMLLKNLCQTSVSYGLGCAESFLAVRQSVKLQVCPIYLIFKIAAARQKIPLEHNWDIHNWDIHNWVINLCLSCVWVGFSVIKTVNKNS